MTGAIAIGGIICVIAAIAGDCSQDLKTGFIVGATPKKQQIGEMIGVVVSAAAIGFVLQLLDNAWGYGSEAIPAPQATMMKMLVEGIMSAELPWSLILIGVCVAIVMEILKVPVMPFAVGMYLPFSLMPELWPADLSVCSWTNETSLKKRKRQAWITESSSHPV